MQKLAGVIRESGSRKNEVSHFHDLPLVDTY